LLVFILFLAWGVRLFWLTDPGYEPDVLFFVPWMRLAAQHGVTQLFAVAKSSYPPLSVFWLAGLGLISSPADLTAAVLPVELMFLRTAVIVFDLLLIALLYALGRRAVGHRIGLTAAILYAFTPGSIYLSGWWIQTDAWFILPTVMAVGWLAQKRVLWAWIALGAAIALKVQAVVILPMFVVGTWRWFGFKRLFGGLALLGMTLLLFLSPILLAGQMTALVEKTTQTVRSLPWITAQSHNLWYALAAEARTRGFDVNSDWNAVLAGVSYHDAGLILLALGYAAVLIRLLIRSGPQAIYAASGLGWFLFFMLPTRIHGRYLFPVLALLLCAGFYQRRWWWLYGVTAVTLFFNLFFHSLSLSPWADTVSFSPGLGVLSAWINVLALGVAFIWYFQPLRYPAGRQQAVEGTLSAMNARWEKWLLGAAAIFLLAVMGLMIVRGRQAGHKVAQWVEPLPPSLESSLSGGAEPASTLVVNWPRMVRNADIRVLGVVPVTPPAIFLPLPEAVAPAAVFVQYPPWQAETGLETMYHGQFVTEEELRTAVAQSQTIIAFNPAVPAMYTLLQRQTAVPDGDCPAKFDDRVCLWQLSADPAADSLQIRLVWQAAAAAVEADLTVFVHIVDEAGTLIAQSDGDPAAGLIAIAGLADDRQTLAETRLTALPAGDYSIHVGLYHRLTGERLPVYCDDTAVCTADSVTSQSFRP
jgi:Gpi18-like mannosyltransferase